MCTTKIFFLLLSHQYLAKQLGGKKNCSIQCFANDMMMILNLNFCRCVKINYSFFFCKNLKVLRFDVFIYIKMQIYEEKNRLNQHKWIHKYLSTVLLDFLLFMSLDAQLKMVINLWKKKWKMTFYQSTSCVNMSVTFVV